MSVTSSNTNCNSQKIRIVFLGDQGVGKSSIIDRYTTNRYDQTQGATVGIDFTVKDVTSRGRHFRLQMWDTAGQERYRSMISNYLKNAQLAIFVCDVTKESSLENVAMWHRLFREQQEAPGIMVANKIDLSNARKVSKQDGQALANKLHLKYFEVSAKTGKRINELFEEVLQLIVNQAKNEDMLIQSSRDKMRDLKTTQGQDADAIDETRQEGKPRAITLKSKGEEPAKNVKCCK